MSTGPEGHTRSGLNRREFLGVGAVPLVAGLATEGSHAERTSLAEGARSVRSQQAVVRVGLIGAGFIVQRTQLPNFRRIPECTVVAVANSSLASSRRVADAFDIPRAYANWRELLDDEGVDAVMIGTPPYMHRFLTLEALARGKHVLCQSRMAMTAAGAREMLEAALRRPDLVCRLMAGGGPSRLKQLVDDGFVGEVLSASNTRLGTDVTLYGDSPELRSGFVAMERDLNWRVDPDQNGFNIPLGLGAAYESLSRVLGRATRVMAMSKVHAPLRRSANGELVAKGGVDHMEVLYETAGEAQVHLRVSTTTGLAPANETWIFGTEGTIRVAGGQVLGGRRGDSQLRELPDPPEGSAPASAGREQRFIDAIRGLEPNTTESLEIGVDYMEFSEAVHLSAQGGRAVTLPL